MAKRHKTKTGSGKSGALHNPHDHYVRNAMQIRELAIAFFQFAVDERWKAYIDWDTMQPAKESFIDDRLQAHFTDICFKGLAHGSQPVRISLLLEHKSEAPPRGALKEQLGRYIFNAWRKDIHNKQPLSVHLAIVLYHGRTPIPKEDLSYLFPNVPAWVLGYVPDFNYVLVDLSLTEDAALEKQVFLPLFNFLLALKYSRNDAAILVFWEKFVNFAVQVYQQPDYASFVWVTVRYLSYTSPVFSQKIRTMHNTATSPSEKVFKTYLDELYENGIEKGQILAIKTFLLKNPDWTDRQVSACFEVDEALVKTIRNEIISGPK